MTIRMSELKQGQAGRIVDLQQTGSMRRRLLDLGFVPGTLIRRVMTSPAGDPVCYNVRGALIALRQSDAMTITIAV